MISLLWLQSRAPSLVETDPEATLSITVEKPSEERPSDEYSVPDGQPLSIEIAMVGIKGYIQRVGIDQHGAVAAPNNVHLAGWFVDSVLPGQKGLSIIDGHEGGPTMDGIFKQLPEVEVGDEVVVTMGGGTRYTYKIFAVKVVPKDQAASILFEQDPASVNGQLNLITCVGEYDDIAGTYSDRSVIYAALQ